MSAFDPSLPAAAQRSAIGSTKAQGTPLTSPNRLLGMSPDFSDIDWTAITLECAQLQDLAGANLGVSFSSDLPIDGGDLASAALAKYSLMELKFALAVCGVEMSRIPASKSDAVSALSAIITRRSSANTNETDPTATKDCGTLGATASTTRGGAGSVVSVSPKKTKPLTLDDIEKLSDDKLLSEAGFTIETTRRTTGKGSYKTYIYNSPDGARKLRSLKQARLVAKALLVELANEANDGMVTQSSSATEAVCHDDNSYQVGATQFDERPSLTLEAMLRSANASHNSETPNSSNSVTTEIESSNHPIKVDKNVVTKLQNSGPSPLFPVRCVDEVIDNNCFQSFIENNNLVLSGDDTINNISTMFANYYKLQNIKSLATPEKFLAYIQLLCNGKLQSKYDPESIKVTREWLESELNNCQSSRSIVWWHTVLHTLSLMTFTEVAMVLPPDGRMMMNGCRVISYPDSESEISQDGNGGVLFVRVKLDYSKITNKSDGGNIIIGAVAYRADYKNDPSLLTSDGSDTAPIPVVPTRNYVYQTPDKLPCIPNLGDVAANRYAQPRELKEKQTYPSKSDDSAANKTIESTLPITGADVTDSSNVGKWPSTLDECAPLKKGGSNSANGVITIDVSHGFSKNGSNEQNYLVVINLGRRGWYFKSDVMTQCARTYFRSEANIPEVYVSWTDQFIRQVAYGKDKLHRRQLRPHEPAGTMPYPSSRFVCTLSVNPRGFGLDTTLNKFESVLKRMFTDGTFPAHMMVKYMATTSSSLFNGFMSGNYRAPPNKGKPYVDENELKEQVKDDFESTFRNGFGTMTKNIKLDKFLPDIAIKKFVQSLGYRNFEEMVPEERVNLYKSGVCPKWDEIKTETISGGFE